MKWSGVRPSVRLSHHLTVACSGFATERHVGRRYRPTSAAAGRPAAAAPQHGTQEQMRAVSL